MRKSMVMNFVFTLLLSHYLVGNDVVVAPSLPTTEVTPKPSAEVKTPTTKQEAKPSGETNPPKPSAEVKAPTTKQDAKSSVETNPPKPSAEATPASAKPAVPSPPSPALIKLADAIQKQYNLTKSASFRFDQTYKHPFLTGTDANNNSKGDASYDKVSGSMMWNYAEPKNRQKKFFINGNKFTFYSISDKIAYTHNCYDKDTLSASVAFLLGTGNLKDSFTITAMDGALPNKALFWLSLLPKEANAPVKKISLGATKDGKVLESIVEDPSGGKNHFKFIDFKVNPTIASSVFVFKAPAGVSVQPMPNIQCAEPAKKPTTPAAPVAPSPSIPAKPAKPAPKARSAEPTTKQS